VRGEDLILLGVDIFDLCDCFLMLCNVLARLVFCTNEVVLLFPNLEEFYLDDHDHRGGPGLASESELLYLMPSEVHVL
jgi:hypothetical protein